MTPEAAATVDRALIEHSRSLILNLQTPEGAYPASPTFSAYAGYCWFRDGAFIADAMSTIGERESAEAFFAWCASVIRRHGALMADAIAATREGTTVADDHMFPARFRFDGSLGDDEWWDFQLDGIGTWLWALGAHSERHGTPVTPYADAIALSAEYLVASWSRPCFDWWEEHAEAVHVSTLGCIAAGLRATLDMSILNEGTASATTRAIDDIVERIRTQGTRDGHLSKWIGHPGVDGSLSALIAPLGLLSPDDALARRTLEAIETDLAVDGGVHRFTEDTFYGGGQWPLLSCFAGLAWAALGDTDKARAYLAWAASTATASGDVPEQVDRHLLFPSRKAEWVAKWGEVATPLLWSHAMILKLNHEVAS